jgi:hypothetical protein
MGIGTPLAMADCATESRRTAKYYFSTILAIRRTAFDFL